MTPVETTIRPVERADLLAVVRIERACFSDPWAYDVFERLLDEPGFLVAEREGTVVGFVVGDVTPNAGRDIGHVKDLAVRPDSRERGIGRALLRSGLARLRAAGAAVVRLEVRESNEVARSLYAEEGFEPIRRAANYYRDGEDALVLAVDLAVWANGE
ncbi:ribosomal-protein-alanine N-acetyltransferase [Halorubrum alkaliphilum]|uniref:Ribosomal-protein-alanine N-acetyltransferase n=1 Tax=Halorubrum alkaliphilum TaxID=261290 RepID=A0A8T4GCH9_9EURY|nr:ribosomal protein S18-alanine N-acetyltransferase [Halorubrum alkaliphilum]MBP1921816.1 ribosomal-protein-alanine N-acetyltransferase [Halorubrum alkaliphilum]